MANLRILCEQYIKADDELKRVNECIDNSANSLERSKYVAEYVHKFIELEDFKSGIRRQLIKELINGIGD